VIVRWIIEPVYADPVVEGYPRTDRDATQPTVTLPV
jgi:hypothetical protein